MIQNDENVHGYEDFVDVVDVALDITDLESNSYRDELGDEHKAKFSNNLFHGMHPLPSCLVNVNEDIPSQMVDINHQNIEWLHIFMNQDHKKQAIGKKCLLKGFQMRTSGSTKSRYEVVCVGKN